MDKKFAKTASAAFNKRITVLTFQKTADEHRSEPFALTDSDVVYGLLGGEQDTKQASVAVSAFRIWFDAAPVMKKTASLTIRRPLYEDTVDTVVYKQHIASMLDKQAAAFGQLSGMLESLDSDIKERSQRLASYFQKTACGSFEFSTLVNLYGDEFKEAMAPYLPESTDFTKTASFAIAGNSPVYKETKELLEKRADYTDIFGFFCDYSRGLQEFSKTAAAFGDMIAKAEYKGLAKTAGVGGSTLGGLIQGTAL